MAQKAASRYGKSPKIDAKESKDPAGAEKDVKAKSSPKVEDEAVAPKTDTEATPTVGDSTGTESVPVNGAAMPAGDSSALHAQMMRDMAKRHMAEMTQTHRRHQRERADMYASFTPGAAADATGAAADKGG